MLSTIERFWLISIRMAWRLREDATSTERLIDRLLEENGLKPAGCCLIRLMHALQAEGATHLYIEQISHPEPTGDERDVLTALRCCYLDDALGAEHALGALLPPGAGGSALRAANDIALAHRLNVRCSHSFSFDRLRGSRGPERNRPPTPPLDGIGLPLMPSSPGEASSSRPQDRYARPKTPTDRHTN